MWYNVFLGIWAQRNLRSACASAQSDQPSLSAWSNTVSLATHRAPAKTQIRLRGCIRAVWSESSLGAFPQAHYLVLLVTDTKKKKHRYFLKSKKSVDKSQNNTVCSYAKSLDTVRRTANGNCDELNGTLSHNRNARTPSARAGDTPTARVESRPQPVWLHARSLRIVSVSRTRFVCTMKG